jgi:CRP-like cAMP-binding protein
VVTISQEELARRIGATRQTTAKILGQWRRAGWIVTGRGRIVVLDRAALRKVTGDM